MEQSDKEFLEEPPYAFAYINDADPDSGKHGQQALLQATADFAQFVLCVVVGPECLDFPPHPSQ